jgi:hypothetical protein
VVVCVNTGLSEMPVEFKLSGIRRNLVEVWPGDRAPESSSGRSASRRYEGSPFVVTVPARSVLVLSEE